MVQAGLSLFHAWKGGSTAHQLLIELCTFLGSSSEYTAFDKLWGHILLALTVRASLDMRRIAEASNSDNQRPLL